MPEPAVSCERAFVRKSGMKTIRVGPRTAKKWLATQKRNRKMKPAKILFYARMMQNGEWQLNGEALKFDRNGHLIDGQNRLKAVVESGCSIRFDVRYGLDPDTQMSMDGGVQRSKADNLHIIGATYEIRVATLCDNLVRWEHGRFWQESYPVTKGENMEMFGRDPEGITESASIAASGEHVLFASVGGVLHYLFSGVDEGDADHFFGRLYDGVDLGKRDPIRHLRNRCLEFLRQRQAKRDGRAYSGRDSYGPRRFLTLLTGMAWNHHRAGRKVSKIILPKSGIVKFSGLTEGVIPQHQ